MLKKSMALGFLLALTGCSSAPVQNKVSLTDDTQKFDKQLNFNSTADEKVIVRDNDVVFQKRQALEARLNRLETRATDLQNSIYGISQQEPNGLWLKLKSCLEKISDSRIGGTGNREPMTPWENVTAHEGDFRYVVDKHDSIVGVSEEQVDARITRFEKYVKVLTDKYSEFDDKLNACENRYREALIHSGINPESMKPQGEWVYSPELGYKIWKLTREQSFDPSELQKRSGAGQ